MSTALAQTSASRSANLAPLRKSVPVATVPDMLDGWTDEHSATFQSDIMTFRHRLEKTGLFSDDALVDLLERHPGTMLDVCTMGAADHPLYPNRFRTGDFRGIPGADLLAAAKAGKIWINVRQAMNIHPEYKAVLDRMYGDLSEATGNRAFNAKGGILISSPVARVPYHFDKTEVILWHVRGRKTVYVWPVNQTFIPDRAHEATLTNMIDDDLPYTADFEQHATVLRLEDGDGATWPLNAPHRVDNETFCVSVTTEYSTTESGMKNAAMLTNATMRRYLGAQPLYERDGAMSRQVKSFAGRIIRKTPLAKDNTHTDMVTFRIDASQEGYLVDVEPFERNF
ncbi:hypothetical protein ACFFUB_14780 [Algimonas porphyrae]|uniref:JmjC domain-containing protein n=1 Tax=Algimonas porphyrae TaxID=1128113 RepID=A0ABQ5UXW2_9PROT|nr:hypothetical protein [Algimonas porphyrae]GLQ19692.1 hypothetical protein GCM10007854_06470 [Algimonas porphyrae]